MGHPEVRDEKFLVEQLGQVIGGKIEAVALDKSEDPDLWIGLKVKLPNGQYKIVWFYGDEEGNYPGTFSIDSPDDTPTM